MKSIHPLALVFIAVYILAACAPASRPTTTEPSVQQLAGTIAAATINAKGPETVKPAGPPTELPIIPTTKPTLSIHADNSACRSGPGVDFKAVATFAAGTTVDMLGKDTAGGYWIVLDPTSHNPCWIRQQDATPSGSFDSLPEMTPQAVSVSVPNKPSKGAWNFACDNTSLTTILAWYAPSGPINGYRIYREGSQIADVPNTQTSYTEKVPFTYGSSMQYAVAAYNDAGVSSQTVWNFHCP